MRDSGLNLQFDLDRANPSEDFISRVRNEFSVEREMDHVLTRKLRQRSGPGYRDVPLATLVERLEDLLRARMDTPFSIRNPRWLQGGSSKLQVAFDLIRPDEPGVGEVTTALVLRMEPPEAIVATSRRREFEMIKAMEGTVPVPPVYWIDAEGDYLPHPGLIYGFAPGVTHPPVRPGQAVRGAGTNFSPELRKIIARQFIDHLVALHNSPSIDRDSLTHFEPAAVGSNAGLIRQINWWRRVWEEDRPEAEPLMEVANRWLIDNAPPLDHVSIIHGDYRVGNFLLDVERQEITAILDWELSVLGDRHQDLMWSTAKSQSRYAEDGKTLLASGLLPAEEFFERYEVASGLPVDPKRLKYFRVFNDFCSTAHMLATAWRVSRYSKSHQDIQVTWHSIAGNVILARLRDTLEELI